MSFRVSALRVAGRESGALSMVTAMQAPPITRTRACMYATPATYPGTHTKLSSE